MTDHSHLHAIEARLINERARLAAAKTDAEREMRRVWVAGVEREMEAERQFLGLPPQEPLPSLDDVFAEMDDDEILAELFG